MLKLNKIIQIIAVFITLQTNSYAENFIVNSTIEVIESLNVLQQQSISFGRIFIPENKVTASITKEGEVNNEVNTAEFENTNGISAGIYKIEGFDNQSITISAQNGNSTPGMTFSELNAKYDDKESNILESPITSAKSSSQGKDLILAASLEIDGNLPEGSFTPDFILEISYE